MFNVLDLVILAVLLLSGLIAAWRGFTREVLSIGAWVGAAVVMFLFAPRAVPLAAQYVSKDIFAEVIAYAAVFVVALLPLSYISYRIAEGVRDSYIGPVDRLFGFAFGIARGLVIIGIGFLVFTSLVADSRQPDWFREARLLPLAESTGKVIASFLPERSTTAKNDAKPEDDPVIGGKKKPAPEATKPEDEPDEAAAPEPEEEPAPPAPRPKPPKPEAPKPASTEGSDATPADSADAQPGGYGERERDALDQLIGSATASPGANAQEASGH